mmetsp:Transcript_29680/g.98335  ORF Transcript_29680/g.98335 Transcript_29680/m.98335 type:complete len:246 (+) Transcript_29680:1608-2345(+)
MSPSPARPRPRPGGRPATAAEPSCELTRAGSASRPLAGAVEFRAAPQRLCEVGHHHLTRAEDRPRRGVVTPTAHPRPCRWLRSAASRCPARHLEALVVAVVVARAPPWAAATPAIGVGVAGLGSLAARGLGVELGDDLVVGARKLLEGRLVATLVRVHEQCLPIEGAPHLSPSGPARHAQDAVGVEALPIFQEGPQLCTDVHGVSGVRQQAIGDADQVVRVEFPSHRLQVVIRHVQPLQQLGIVE